MANQFVLVDTNAFIHLTRGRSKAERLRPFVEQSRMVLSFVTVAELRLGAEVRGYNEASRRRMESEIGGSVVVPPTDELSHEWARLTCEARAMNPGHALGQQARSRRTMARMGQAVSDGRENARTTCLMARPEPTTRVEQWS